MAGAAGGSGEPPFSLGGLTVSSTPLDLRLDLFGVAGHRMWIEVSEEQLTEMNDRWGGDPWYGDDIYAPGGGKGSGTFADHVLVEDFATKLVADYGKLEVKLIGESTFREWTASSIPNVRIDTDEFQDGMRIGTTEHLRLNNSQVGSIFREYIAHHIYGELGYPALRSTYAFLASNFWGEDVWVPMTLIEVYKCRTMEDREDELGGSCENMWEFAGDVGSGYYGGIPDDACQNGECDDTRLEELSEVLSATLHGEGFMDALEPYIDWEMYHRFQCLSWIMWTGDDPIHNSNNNPIIERDDGRMVWAPYSIDISAGQDWSQNTTLTGDSSVPSGCQSDPECWEGTIAACESLITEFQALHPETIVDQTEALLDEHGMMRKGDEDRAHDLRQWFVDRQAEVWDELELYRYLPDEEGNCPEGLVACNGRCGTEEQCAQSCDGGAEWCEAYGYCIYSYWDSCPECTEEAPVWCGLLNSCVASDAECFIECENLGEVYCAMYGQCMPEGDCNYYWDDPFV